MILKIVHSPVAVAYKEAAEITSARLDGKTVDARGVLFTGWERGAVAWEARVPESGWEAYIMTNDGRTFERFCGAPCDVLRPMIPRKPAA